MAQSDKIPFNRSPRIKTFEGHIQRVFEENKLSGDGVFTALCSAWLQKSADVPHALLTTSCSHALDMSAYLCDLEPGDEVILPSYTFSSTANSFAGVGASLVFVDIRPDTMNIDETKIEAALTSRTRAIVPIHYAGVGCEMDVINDIARRHDLLVVEDAAQGVLARYKNQPLGSLSDFGCFSFHETKNYSMGEGGALLLHDANLLARAEIMREKGTDRSRFFRGQVDKYSWVNWGSSYLPSELNAAYLWSQLEIAETIHADRMASWNRYYEALSPLATDGRIALPHIPAHCAHNAHMFYLKARDLDERTALIRHLGALGISAVYHYVPLHAAAAGLQFGRFHGEDRYTTAESERLVRLPMFYGLTEQEIERVCCAVLDFYAAGPARQ